jgi:hypothetical protein
MLRPAVKEGQKVAENGNKFGCKTVAKTVQVLFAPLVLFLPNPILGFSPATSAFKPPLSLRRNVCFRALKIERIARMPERKAQNSVLHSRIVSFPPFDLVGACCARHYAGSVHCCCLHDALGRLHCSYYIIKASFCLLFVAL